MADNYAAADIEVLTGLEPVRKRPGMYTDTSRPNHLVQEVVDNSVDEAIIGHADKVEVTLHKDDSVTVADNGRGMPVDIHPGEKLPGVEVILTRLHAGGKFSDKNYRFSGGLHGVGVSVVNGLSKHLEVWVKRDGKEYNMAFAGGKPVSPLEVAGEVGKPQHRHHPALLAGPGVFRFRHGGEGEAETPAARQGGVMPRPHCEARRRSRRRTDGMALRGRHQHLPVKHAVRRGTVARGAVYRPHAGQ